MSKHLIMFSMTWWSPEDFAECRALVQLIKMVGLAQTLQVPVESLQLKTPRSVPTNDTTV